MFIAEGKQNIITFFLAKVNQEGLFDCAEPNRTKPTEVSSFIQFLSES